MPIICNPVISASDTSGGIIKLGVWDTLNVKSVQFDISSWQQRFGDGQLLIINRRPGETTPYQVDNVTIANGIATWTFDETDTAISGYGSCALAYIVEDEYKARTPAFTTYIAPTLGNLGPEPPDPLESWYSRMLDAAASVQGAAEQTGEDAAAAAQSAVDAKQSADAAQQIAETVAGDVTDAQQASEAAQAAQQAAAQSASDASASAGSAQSSAAQAAQSASAAQGSATAAAQSAAEAAQSAESVAQLEALALGAYAVKTISGNPATCSDGADGVPIKALSVTINPVQAGSGDPSPTNIRPISGWTGATIKRYGADESDHLQTVTVDFGEAGTVYGGTLDVITGDLVVDKRMQVMDGTENWVYENNTGGINSYYIRLAQYNYMNDRKAGALGNALAMNRCVGTSVRVDNSAYVSSGGYFNLRSTMLADEIAVKASLAETPLQVLYPLAEPLTYQLSPQQLTTLLGTNNILADTGTVTCEYRRDPTLALAALEGGA